MHLITSAEFYSTYQEMQSVIFVGNAPSMKDSGLGEWIDGFDLVVRFNECVTVGYEEDVGSKTDILVVNPYITPKDRAKTLQSLNSCETVLIISPETRRAYSEDLKDIVENKKVLFTYTPDILFIESSGHIKGLTTGTYGVYLLTRMLSPKYVAITGFTMFLNDTASHYWQSTKPSGLHAHDVLREAEIFVDICNKINCNVEVTSDIAWVAQQVKKTLRNTIKIKQI